MNGPVQDDANTTASAAPGAGAAAADGNTSPAVAMSPEEFAARVAERVYQMLLHDLRVLRERGGR